MKVFVEPHLIDPDAANPQVVRLPLGLVGFPQHTSFSLSYEEEQLPFRWLRLEGDVPLQFVVIDPIGVIPDYEAELFDEDARFLSITTAADALVLNIVTVGRSQPATATVNLVAPIVINRHTGLAKQVVLANHTHYNVRHPLVTA